ncbi:MAG: HD domain-containing protein [Ktedonobacteraceae bacterium]
MVNWAAEQAATLLTLQKNRWLHVQGVVKIAYLMEKIFDKEDYAYLIAAAYLHDIGYAPQIRQTGFHPLDGARFILSSLNDMRLASLVAHHSEARFEAQLRGYAGELQAFPHEQSAVADSLTYCDQITGPTGLRVSLQDRTNEIIHRYGERHIVTQALHLSLPYVTLAVARTEQKLAEHGITG